LYVEEKRKKEIKIKSSIFLEIIIQKKKKEGVKHYIISVISHFTFKTSNEPQRD
jgi:hypothetical protein